MQTATSVLVVGAGPTGLLMAAELRRRGVPCELIDANPGPLPWDRATVVHARSLEVFESLGIVDQFLDAGTPQRGARIHSGGEVLGSFDLADCGSRYQYSLGLSEEVTEAVLTDYLHAQGGEVERSSRLVGLVPNAGGVVASIDRHGERREVDAQWVVGCDGIHSATRASTGIEFVGHDIAAPWAVFDTTLANWPDVYDLTFVYLEELPLILTAIPGQRWRAYLRPSSPDSDLVADAVSTLCQYHPAVSFVDVENPTRFHCHSMVATAYRSDRILLAGDAAHLCSPAQGHGMNTGLQDAFNLAWKLALVHHGTVGPDLLDTFEAERRAPAELVARTGDDFESAQMTTGADERAARDQGMRTTFADPGARHHEAVAEAELDVNYAGSPIVAGATAGPLGAGQRLADTIAVDAPGVGACGLHELAHRAGHTLLVLRGPASTDADAGTRELIDQLRAFVDASSLFDASMALGAVPDPDAQVGRLDAAIAGELGVRGTTVVAMRPDGYIGLRADDDHLEAVRNYEALVRRGRG